MSSISKVLVSTSPKNQEPSASELIIRGLNPSQDGKVVRGEEHSLLGLSQRGTEIPYLALSYSYGGNTDSWDENKAGGSSSTKAHIKPPSHYHGNITSSANPGGGSCLHRHVLPYKLSGSL